MRTVVASILAAALVMLGVALYVRTTGLSALPAPGPLETRVSRFVRGFSVPADVRRRVNPVQADAAALAEGLEHFADHCAACHANDGSGAVEMGRNLYPKAPDLRASSTQTLTDGELFWIIEKGIRFTGMPGWSTGTSDGEASSWRLVHFIRHLPRLSAGEKARMESLNPRSPDEIRQEIEEERFLRGETP